MLGILGYRNNSIANSEYGNIPHPTTPLIMEGYTVSQIMIDKACVLVPAVTHVSKLLPLDASQIIKKTQQV
jgi:hypothetical protein